MKNIIKQTTNTGHQIMWSVQIKADNTSSKCLYIENTLREAKLPISLHIKYCFILQNTTRPIYKRHNRTECGNHIHRILQYKASF